MDFFKNSVLKYILIGIILLVVFYDIYIYVSKNSAPKSIDIENPQQKSGEQATETIEPITVLFLGDMMFDRKVELAMEKNGFFYPFEKIKDFLRNNDFVFANLEGPISKNPLKFSLSAMTFAFSDKIIEPLVQANFKVLSLANNHALNMYQKGLDGTKQLLTNAGIEWVGEPLDCSDRAVIKGNLVFLAFNKTFVDCKDEKITEIVKATKDSNPEKFLTVSMHWGEEYKTQSSQAQKALAHKIIDFGADLIVGSHPHVVQESEKYKDKMIFYSLGNFVFDQYFSQDTQEGLAIRLELYGSKIIYRVFPLESILSQPQLMEKSKAEEFLKKRNFESIIGINGAQTQKACFDKNCFYVEIVEKPQDLALGLMFRKYLDDDRGMLFVFQNEAKYSFWMKNTLIPLDMIWLNTNKEVVYIAKNVEPCKEDVCRSIDPNQKAKYVLELNAGTADTINLKIGDKLIFDMF